jgi:hypothetical protein
MPEVGTRVRIREGEASAVARQTLDSEPRGSFLLNALGGYLAGSCGVVTRAAHTNGDIRVKAAQGQPMSIFAYGAQVEEIE